MLQNVNLLYLGLFVLMLLDSSYMSRFWTQMEAWLSMQQATASGLMPAPEEKRRCEVVMIHNASLLTRQDLLARWAQASLEDTKSILAE